jgi:glycosyltransferase involved in cell wall biosynthesis
MTRTGAPADVTMIDTGKNTLGSGPPVSGSRLGPIAFFLPSLRGGGAERVVVNLTRGIVERGLPVDLVVVAAKGVFLDQLHPAVRLVDLGASRVLRTLGPLVRYLRAERPRVLISSMHHANLIALWAAGLARTATPVVVTIHNTLSQTPRGAFADTWIWPLLIRAFYSRAKRIVAVSRGTADDLSRTARIQRNRIEVIYNPVITAATATLAREPVAHPWFKPGEPPVIVAVGRLTWAKDFPTLIRAFAGVRRRRPARLLILGDGEERAALTSLVDDLGISGDVSLAGFQPNALAIMAHSAVFVLSSVSEALPTVLIEALAAGARVVATNCHSGPREILQQGRLGTLVPVGDVAAMTAAILDALDRPVLVPAVDALAPFTQDTAVDHYLRLIETAR